MAAIDELIQQIADPVLRQRIRAEVDDLSKRKKFGLVFENHLAECVPLYDAPIKQGALVTTKIKSNGHFYLVQAVQNDQAVLIERATKDVCEMPLKALVVVADIGEPIYPYLKYVDSVSRSPGDDLWHALIESDNYHALQLLEYLYPGKVDCIYIDPPYNSGAKDWKYNNDYVDENDSYRHSKWLSMMEKRLRIAQKLLNPQKSVLIVTIDEKEYLRLGLLLEEIFPNGKIQMVSSVINPAGAGRRAEFARTDEYLFFVRIGELAILPESREMENVPVIWDTLRRSSLANARGRHGKGACGPNQFFPIYVDVESGRIKEIGDPIPETMDRHLVGTRPGCCTVFPIRPDGTEMNWGITPDVARERLAKGYLRAGKRTPGAPQEYVISYVTGGNIKDIESGIAILSGYEEDGSVIAYYPKGRDKMPTTNWNRATHDAQRFGTNLLSAFIGNRFPYPKSLYAVEDCLRLTVGDNPKALVLDFFAGSGTTLHAVNLLNKIDGGKRRCIMVTNNEVSPAEEKRLSQEGFFPGDEEWERLGIAQYVNWPRTKCSILGTTIEGSPVKGEYSNTSYLFSEGFDANAVYYKLGFLDKTSVALGRQFRELIPIIWMKAGCYRKCPVLPNDDVPNMLILPDNRFAVLINESFFDLFAAEVEKYPEIETVYIVTNSDIGYKEMALSFEGKQTYQLYRDYLDNFRLNVRK